MNCHFSNLAHFLRSHGFLPKMSSKESLNPKSFQPSHACLEYPAEHWDWRTFHNSVDWGHWNVIVVWWSYQISLVTPLPSVSPTQAPPGSLSEIRPLPISQRQWRYRARTPSTFCIGVKLNLLLSVSTQKYFFKYFLLEFSWQFLSFP